MAILQGDTVSEISFSLAVFDEILASLQSDQSRDSSDVLLFDVFFIRHFLLGNKLAELLFALHAAGWRVSERQAGALPLPACVRHIILLTVCGVCAGCV